LLVGSSDGHRASTRGGSPLILLIRARRVAACRIRRHSEWSERCGARDRGRARRIAL